MDKSAADNAAEDTEARAAIWKTICLAADDIRHRFKVEAIHELDQREIRSTTSVPTVATWQLMEALSLLCVIVRSSDAKANVVNVFGKMGPIEIREDGVTRYLWAQQTILGEKSALRGRPDIVVTSSSDRPNSRNTVRIIEAKCVRTLGSPTIRGEFGKAYDLRVTSYFIWSYYSPSPKVIDGARGLGITLEALGFDTNRRHDLVSSPEALLSHVAHSQEQARRGQRFAQTLLDAGQDAERKLLSPEQ
jgi:hypothetical protein